MKTNNKTDLVEIKKDKTGHGLLIEHDGYISMSEGQNKKLMESIDSSDNWHCPYPFIVHAVFQKAGIKNANGRIYPRNVLEKQIELYQQRIAEKRALGECYTPDVLVLTEKGWKELREIKEGENILTLNTDTDEIEIKPVLRKIEKDFDGNMIEIRSRNILDLVTPNHEFPLYSRNHKYIGSYSAKDILEGNVKDLSHNYIPKRGNWIGKSDEYFIIPNLPDDITEQMSSNIQKKYNSDLIIPMHIFAKFMGIYLAEGFCDKNEKGTRVCITQKKEAIILDIKNMLEEWGIPFTINKKEDGSTTFVICDMRLCAYLQQFGLCYDKFVPFELKQQNKKTLQLFYEWFVKGDGRIRGDRKKRTILTNDVFSTSKQLILDLNEIQLKIGFSGSYHIEQRDNDRYIHDRLIEGKNTQPLHFSLRSRARGIYLDNRHFNISEVPYKGEVMCLEVENHTFYVMSNGHCHWSHNCNHPAESVIDLGRISHNIIELHWEGNTVVGKLELNLSPGYVKYGICSTLGDTTANLLLNGYKIGVSSRGVGSVEQKMGVLMVGDDFELICWDIVSDPSTPSAYIGNSHEELQPYVESVDKKSKNIVLEKVDRIKGILKS